MKKTRLQAMIPAHVSNLEEYFDNKRDVDKAKLILQYLFYMGKMMKDNKNFAPGIDRDQRWCPVSSENIKGMVWDYPRIRDILIAKGIIEQKKNDEGKPTYFPGKYSMLYRAKFPKYILKYDKPRYRREYITTKTLIKAVKRHHDKRYEKQKCRLINEVSWYASCVQFMDRFRLEVDLEQIEHTIDPEKLCDRLTARDQFNDGINRYINRDAYGRRIHSYLSHLPKDLRPYLKLDGEDDRLVMVDIKNSQAYFLSALFKFPELIALIPEFEPVENVISNFKGSPSIGMFYQHSRRGILYDKMMETTGMSRKDFKKMLFGHVFFAASYQYSDDEEVARTRRYARNLFQVQYRDALKLLDKLKSTTKNTLPFVYELTGNKGRKSNKYGKMYATPNMMAQRLETKILLDMVTRNAVEQGIETCTLHDAWILRECDLDKFKVVFNSVFNTIGLEAPVLDKQVLKPTAIV